MKGLQESSSSKPVLITGGAGFIGANLAHRLLSRGESVLILDNLSRAGVESNWRWLASSHEASRLALIEADIRDFDAVAEAVAQASFVYHFAAQVAVTTSLENAWLDFSINALGTFNVLRAMGALHEPPPLLYTSTNKVYGSLPNVSLRAHRSRYEPEDAALRKHGISEQQPLEFYSPYGCSKGAADQYVLDHARTMGIRAAVFRMSCIYGPHQFGTEDQGWVAHFLFEAMKENPLTIYGDGRQLRDVLFVEDLVDAMLLARKYIKTISGEAFNIGGGPENTTSLLELLDLIGQINGSRPEVRFEDWRPGDQRYYVSDFSKFYQATRWRPTVGIFDGLRELQRWRQSIAEPSLMPIS